MFDSSLAFTLIRPALPPYHSLPTHYVTDCRDRHDLPPNDLMRLFLDPEFCPSIPGVRASFYAAFWRLELADIAVPKKQYEDRIALYDKQYKEVKAELEKMSDRDRRDRPEYYEKRKKAMASAGESKAKLKEELKEQSLLVLKTNQKIAAEKEKW